MPRNDDEDDYRDDEDAPRRRRNRDRDHDDDDPRPRKKKKGGFPSWAIFLVLGLLGCVVVGGGLAVALLLPAVQKVRDAAARAKDTNNLKQIGLGFHNVADTSSRLPGPYFVDVSKPNNPPNKELSHRVQLLPYLEQQSLYRQFDLTASWDSAKNKPYADMKTSPFVAPIDEKSGSANTRYLSIVGPGAISDPEKPTGIRFSDVSDGTSNTILTVTADETVPWTSPQNLTYEPNGPVPSFGKKAFSGGTNVLMADGSVRFIKNTISDETKRAMITRAGGEAFNIE